MKLITAVGLLAVFFIGNTQDVFVPEPDLPVVDVVSVGEEIV